MEIFPQERSVNPHAPLTRYRAADAAAPARIDQARHEPYYPRHGRGGRRPPQHLYLYRGTAGNQLVESTVIGMLSDISGSDKLIVVQDPFSGLKFIYRVDHESSNLDAAALTEQDGSAFNGKQSVEINAMTCGHRDNAMKLLRGKTHWIQDKGSVLSVLLQNAASRKTFRRSASNATGCADTAGRADRAAARVKTGRPPYPQFLWIRRAAPAGGPAQPARRTGHF